MEHGNIKGVKSILRHYPVSLSPLLIIPVRYTFSPHSAPLIKHPRGIKYRRETNVSGNAALPLVTNLSPVVIR